MNRNYYPYAVIDGKEWTLDQPTDIAVAYDEAVRIKSERHASEAGLKVFTQGCLKIINWKEGRYWRGRPRYLYKITV